MRDNDMKDILLGHHRKNTERTPELGRITATNIKYFEAQVKFMWLNSDPNFDIDAQFSI